MSPPVRKPRLTMLKPRLAEAPSPIKPLTIRQHVRPWGHAERKRRTEILRAAGGRCQCQECKDLGRMLPAHEVDHIVPLADGGTDARENLQAINLNCHRRKTAAEAAARAGKG